LTMRVARHNDLETPVLPGLPHAFTSVGDDR
jgi:hypothetical protein